MRPSPRTLAILGAAAIGSAVAPGLASGASWQFAPAVAPPTPAGAQPAPYGVPLGAVGQISFWSPNRGLLITKGNNVVPMGLYAYDGVSWHQLSTVCGGTDGRIAWAGPDEFWTISDQRPGQVTASTASLADISLCHFKDGQVVGSYAMPLQEADSYLPMDAAVCRNASDCWFGGSKVSSGGGFHLHWDGASVSVVISSQNHGIGDMANVGGTLFESADLQTADPNEDRYSPPALHTIVTGASDPFPSVLPGPDFGAAPDGTPVDPTTQTPLALSSDGGQLWAVAGARPLASPSGGLAPAGPLVLRYAGGVWSKVVPQSGALQPGDQPTAVAADPNSASAWIALDAGDDSAPLVHMAADGSVDQRVDLGPDQGIGPSGTAGPVACPAVNDCWAATSQGLLFHYTDGTALPQDTDPNFAGVIAYRPSDSGVPIVLPDSSPLDDSLANQANQPAPVVPTPPPPKKKKPKVIKAKPLLTKVKTKLLHRTTLAMTFTLTSKANFQLLALRKSKVVAQTKHVVLPKGRHTVTLKLNAKRWPTKFKVRVTVYKPKKKATTKAKAKSPSTSSGTSTIS